MRNTPEDAAATIGFRLPEDIEAKLRARAAADNVAVSDLVREVIAEIATFDRDFEVYRRASGQVLRNVLGWRR
ncbi:MAG: hypothetical protein AB1749_16480 [Pseudomonadota bacterium]